MSKAAPLILAIRGRPINGSQLLGAKVVSLIASFVSFSAVASMGRLIGLLQCLSVAMVLRR